MKNSFNHILMRHNISPTPFRTRVLEVLGSCPEALSQKEIERKLSGAIDRVTFYRTLKLFISKKLVHKITIDDHTIKYQLINPKIGVCHPHFHCQLCDKVICLPELSPPPVKLPSGYKQSSSKIVVEGLCDICK